jgi:uncharacterized membrane protein YfcA
MDVVTIILLLVFGVLFGIISSLAGIGGGGFYTSLMIILFLIPINEARDTSTFIILLFSFVTFLNYYRHGKIDIKISLLFAGFALLGSITATIIFMILPIDNTILKIVIASVILLSGLNMIRKAIKYVNTERKNNNLIEVEFSYETFEHTTKLKVGIPLFFLAGFIAYLTGIGGGMLFVPTLSILLEIPIHFATALSSAMIFFIGIYNAIVRIFIGEIHYLFGILIASGAIVGSLIGTKYSDRIPKKHLKFFVAIILIILAIRLYF